MNIELTREQVDYLLPKLYNAMIKQYNRGNLRDYHKMKSIHDAIKRGSRVKGHDNNKVADTVPQGV